MYITLYVIVIDLLKPNVDDAFFMLFKKNLVYEFYMIAHVYVLMWWFHVLYALWFYYTATYAVYMSRKYVN